MMKHTVSWINLVKNYIIHTIGNMRMVSAIRIFGISISVIFGLITIRILQKASYRGMAVH